ncbi:TasA family protein [Geodermatophilus sp. DSM 44513]|uniref:TasA family protein n=1 Tax=Geodermatophilus sp. DSM 44513 TaxID=1528104 RepID=UPI001277A8DE|nr:TasA family protein [Geodermatophilus sp. DSM 44513]WNV76724.1 TasA family protein [Geodermatophilus sp. DSM 44513]
MRSTRATTTHKVLGSLAVIGTATAVAGLGTFGTFTDTTTPVSATLTSGDVDIDLSQPATRLDTPVTDLVPGDSIARTVTLENNGTSALSSVSLGVTAGSATVLTGDQVNGLQLALTACTVPWTEAAGPTHTCAGNQRAITTAGAVVGDHALDAPASLEPGGADHLLVTLTLPTTAGNAFQGQSTTLTLTFAGVQRAGTAR